MGQNLSRIVAIFVLLASVGLSACASVPMASLEEDSKAKTFAVDTDKSNIYLYRNEAFGGAVPMSVALNGKLAGQTGPKTYFLWVVDPGVHEVTSLSENNVSIKLNTEPGKAYYVWQEVKMGLMMARSQLHHVDEDVGRKGVAECKLAKSNF